MKSKSITYTKNHFSAVVREVQEGVSYLVCDHEKPVALLSPVKGGNDDVAGKNLAALEKSGLVTRGSRALPREFFTDELPSARSGESVVSALLEEREHGR